MSDSPRTPRQVLAVSVAWLCRHWWIVLAVLGLFTVLSVGVVLSLHLATVSVAPLLEQADQITDSVSKDRVIAIKDISQYQLDNQIKIWIGLVQAVGAVVLAIGGYFTWRNLRVGQENLRATQQKLDIDREGQITNRFTQAVAQLGAELKDGNPNLEIRLGGIYALERIARDSSKDHWTIMEVLTAYVRQNAPWPPGPPAPLDPDSSDQPERPSNASHRPRVDIQAILTVLGRRTQAETWLELGRIDLSHTDLQRAFLREAHLEKADLREVHLEGADLFKAHLEGADLRETHLKRATLIDAHLEKANLTDAHLERADLTRAHLEGTQLWDAHLERANLTRAHLEGAHLWEAHLEGALLIEAHLEGADLSDAYLKGVHLRGAYLEGIVGLTPQQLQQAINGGQDAASLPEHLRSSDASPGAASDSTISDLTSEPSDQSSALDNA